MNDDCAKRYHQIAFCTTSMNRLNDVRETLPSNLELAANYGKAEWILLDYSSEDGLVNWVREHCAEFLRSGILKVYQVLGKQYFHVAHAKNIAHRQASAEIVCNIDADNYITSGYAEFIEQSYREDADIFGLAWKWLKDAPEEYAELSKGFGGRLFLSRKNFEELGGYDTRFFGYGMEDRDLITRAETKGLTRLFTPKEFLRTIVTTDESRAENLPSVESVETASEAVALYHFRNRQVYEENKTLGRVSVNEGGWGEDAVQRIA